MRKSFQRTLLRILSCLLCLGLLFLLVNLAVDRIEAYNREGELLTRQIAEMESLLAARSEWEQRALWVARKIPRFETRRRAEEHLIDTVKTSLAKHRLELKQHEILHRPLNEFIAEESETPYSRAEVEVFVLGTEKDIVHWIHDLQGPGNFAAVDHIALEAGSSGMACQARIKQWFLMDYGMPATASIEPGQHR